MGRRSTMLTVQTRSTRVVIVDPRHPDLDVITQAASTIQRGGLVVFPTETVYGLGANALDVAAVASIFDAKKRPPTDPLIVHVADVASVQTVARSTPPGFSEIARRFWPGPLTVILPKRADVPVTVTAGLDSVGVRVPAHPVARALLLAANVPIAAPSANLFSRPSPTRVSHVLADLAGRVDLVLDAGPSEVGLESTILDMTTSPPLIRRPGGVSLPAIREVLANVQMSSVFAGAGEAQVAPGQMLRHYAPRAQLTVFVGQPSEVHLRIRALIVDRATEGIRIGVLAPREDAIALGADLSVLTDSGQLVVQPYGSRVDPRTAARELFDALRRVDDAAVDEIVAVALEDSGIGIAIFDRLIRAAEGRVVRV